MHRPHLHRTRVLAPILLLGGVALLIVLTRHDAIDSPPSLPGQDLQTLLREDGDATPPPVLVGAPHATRQPPSRLSLEALGRLGRFQETPWDVAALIVAEGERCVPVLIRALRGDDGDVGGSAALAMRLIPAPSVPALLDLLHDPDPKARLAALHGLSLLADWWAAKEVGADVVTRLAATLLDAPEEEQRKRAALIAAAGPHAHLGIDALVSLLASAQGETLRDVAGSVGLLGMHRTRLTPVLVTRFLEVYDQTPLDTKLVGGLLDVLGQLGPLATEDTARLAGALPSAPPKVQREMCFLLGDSGEQATPSLSVLESRLLDPETRRDAILSLLDIPGGELSAAQTLIANATRPLDEYFDLRFLSDLDERFAAVVPFLIETATRGEGVQREAAVRALASTPEGLAEQVGPVLREALVHEDAGMRIAAAWAVLWRGACREEASPDEASLLGAALADTDGEVRRIAVMCIGKRHKKSLDMDQALLVAPLLGDPDPDVRFWAGNVIEEIGVAPKSALAQARVNLLHEERLVRLGAARVLATLGPDAAEGVPEMIEAALDDSRDNFGLWPLARTGVMDERVKTALRQIMATDRNGPGTVQRLLEERSALFEPEIKEHLLARPWSGDLSLLARWTPDKESLAAWLIGHRAYFESDELLDALGQVGAPGLPHLLERALGDERRALREAGHAAGRLGTEAAPALLDLASREDLEAKQLAIQLLTEAAPKEGVEAFAAHLDAEDASLRAEAALGLRAAFDAGIDAAPYRDHLRALLADQTPLARDAAWQALFAAGVLPADLVARAEAALDDEDPHVRVGAAETVLAGGGDTERATQVLCRILQVPAPYWGWFGSGSTPARTEDGYSDTERLWARAARALETMGVGAAPAAETLVWAAMRHGEPRMQAILLGPILAMGEAAEPLLPLLDRLAATRDTWLGFHETVGELQAVLKEIYLPFDRRVPQPPDGYRFRVDLEDE